MRDDTVQIFISYARDDDLAPPSGSSGDMGFVKFLHEHLEYKFRNSGPLRPVIWRDIDNVYRGEKFLPRIHEELQKSAIMVVILSQNWMSRDNCKGELEHFLEWRKRQNRVVDEDIILVAKNHVDLERRPLGLQNQEGYRFYELTGRPNQPIKEFFDRGEPIGGSRYWQTFDELFEHLRTRVEHLAREKFAPPPPATKGRTVFVAKPASDMFDEYIGIVRELTNKGYNVVPKRSIDLPTDESIRSFLDRELDDAEASIHLLGENACTTGHEANEFVSLQLARAAAKVPDTTAGATTQPAFHRIIWAPKVLQQDPRSGGVSLKRDPHDVFARFGTECNGDKVFGDDFGSFREALVSHLDKVKQKGAPPSDDVIDVSGAKNNGRVFVLHDEQDRELARRLRKALLALSVEAVLPVRDDDEVKRNALNMDSMRKCDGVVICWGSTTETWTRAQASQFENWRELGRSRVWEPRGVVLGPPPGTYKVEFREDGPPSEIDAVVVVEDLQAIPPDELRKLIPRRSAAER